LHNTLTQVVTRQINAPTPDVIPKAQAFTQKKLLGRVLFAEDNPLNREVASVMLQKMGITLMMANNGQEVLNLISQEKFDLILMDCQMPVMDGFEATRQLRAREAALNVPRIPIIAVTANAISGDREYCLSLGMDDYLSKPFSQEQLYDMLSRWLRAFSDASNTAMESKATHASHPILAENVSVDIDHKVIRQIREMREGLLERVIDIFRTNSKDLVDQLQRAIENADADSAYKIAHNLKNSAANLGLIKLAAVCRECEASARMGVLDQAVNQLKTITLLYDVALHQLNLLEQHEHGQ
jgi:two-component system, sensor histidine kinase and response regulator